MRRGDGGVRWWCRFASRLLFCFLFLRPCFVERGTMTYTRTLGSGGRWGPLSVTGMTLGGGRKRQRNRGCLRRPLSRGQLDGCVQSCSSACEKEPVQRLPAATGNEKLRSRFRFPSVGRALGWPGAPRAPGAPGAPGAERLDVPLKAVAKCGSGRLCAP